MGLLRAARLIAHYPATTLPLPGPDGLLEVSLEVGHTSLKEKGSIYLHLHRTVPVGFKDDVWITAQRCFQRRRFTATRTAGDKRLRKNGHAKDGAQWAKCVDCRRTFVLSPRGLRHDEAFKAQVVETYQDRMSIRGITRTFGICYQTVMIWVGEKVATLPAFEDTLLPNQNEGRAGVS